MSIHMHPQLIAAVHSRSPSYLGGWGWRITGAQEFSNVQFFSDGLNVLGCRTQHGAGTCGSSSEGLSCLWVSLQMAYLKKKLQRGPLIPLRNVFTSYVFISSFHFIHRASSSERHPLSSMTQELATEPGLCSSTPNLLSHRDLSHMITTPPCLSAPGMSF